MEDKSALLNQLRIDRDSGPPPSSRWVLWVIAAAAVLTVAALGWFWRRPSGIPIHVAVAQSAADEGAAAASSILDASGYVVARRQATVASKITGKLEELDIEEGDHVKEGQVIARLDDTNLRAALNAARAQLDYAKSGLAETEVNLKNAKRDYDRQTSLLSGHFVSQSAVDNSQTAMDALAAQLATQRSNIEVAQRNIDLAQRNLDDTVVRAPFSGIVTVKAAQPGEIVSPISAGGGFTRTGIGTIVDMESLEIQVDVNENFINRVQPDQKATAKLNAYPDWLIPGHVIAVIPDRRPQQGHGDRAHRHRPERPPHPAGNGCSGGVLGSGPGRRRRSNRRHRCGAAARRGAVHPAKPGSSFVVHDSTVERRAVRLGASNGERVVVLAGVTPGERVAVGDLSRLKDGAEIHIEP